MATPEDIVSALRALPDAEREVIARYVVTRTAAIRAAEYLDRAVSGLESARADADGARSEHEAAAEKMRALFASSSP